MPYNTRRKSLSLPSLGIHIPVTHAARAASASKGSARPSSSPSCSASPSSAPSISPRSASPPSHASKRQKRSHNDTATDQTPPPSPTPATSVEMPDVETMPKVDLEGINDDIVEAVITQLQSTANRPHLIKELATVLSQKLASVQHSANPCAIISSRLTSYMKRSCWTAIARCPLAKELEPIHPRLSSAASPLRVTPSVSLTDDSSSDDVDSRRRELSPSPEVHLAAPDFDEGDDDIAMPATPIGSISAHPMKNLQDLLHGSPPLEKDEREFTQTADVLQKRKLMNSSQLPSETSDYPYRDDAWFTDNRSGASTTFITSPAMKPSLVSSARKEDEPDSWLKYSQLFEWDRGAESIEIDELDCLLDAC